MASVDFSRDNLATLGRDGISDELYKLLWARDELNFGPQVNIPDTIIYKYGQPVTWYFTSVSGRVKKKNKQNLLSAKIEEVFNKHVLGYDVIAYFITMASEHERSGSDAPTPTIIEYFDRTALKNFLYNHKKGVNGILQRFIEPKSTHNELIRAIWSPKLCLLERAENIHQLHDHRYGLYERCVVYEGPDYYFTSAPLRGPVLSGQLQKVCESIVSHVGEVTYGQKQVTRIVLNFKVDSRDKIWLLYSTSIRCDDMLEYKPVQSDRVERHLVNIESVVSLPEAVNLNPRKTYNKILPKTRISCLSCNSETIDELRYPVTYKAVIKHYDHLLHLLRMSSGTTAAALSGGREAMTPSSASGWRGVVVPWPPDAELIQAAGGVGFGCLNQDDDNPKSEKPRSPSNRSPTNRSSQHLHHHHHVRYKNIKDVAIPPMIAALHPKLNSETYLHCKTDPLFQNKTLHVCEPCYLVYAEFTTMLLRMGGHLSKLLTPDVDGSVDKGHASLAHSGKSPTWSSHASPAQEHPSTASSSLQRPSSADWRAISSTLSQSRFGQQDGLPRTSSSSSAMYRGQSPQDRQHHEEAKARAIGLRSSDVRYQPELPSPIRSASAVTSLSHYDSMPSSPGAGTASSFLGGGGGGVGGGESGVIPGGLLDLGSQSIHDQMVHGYDDRHVAAMIADRERKFFKEISLNPQLKDQHPLVHLITAQQRLQLVDQQSGVLLSKAASAQESVYPAKYGRQGPDRHDKFGAYTAPLPYAINGEIILPSALRARRAAAATAERNKKREALRKLLQAEEEKEASVEMSSQAASVARSGSLASGAGAGPAAGGVAKSSKQHRDFLAESLQQLEKELGEAAAYPPTGDSSGLVGHQTQPGASKVGKKATANDRRREAAGQAHGVSSEGRGLEGQQTLPRGIAIESDELESPGSLHQVEDEAQAEPWQLERTHREEDDVEEVHRSLERIGEGKDAEE